MYWDTLGNAMGPYHPAWSGGEEADAGEGFMGRTGRKRARDEGSEEEDAPKEEGAGVVVVRQGYGQVTTKQDPIVSLSSRIREDNWRDVQLMSSSSI